MGLQETLDLIKETDGKSDVAIYAPTLDKLLTILDARHLWGNYHPAMALKAKIEKLDGANAGSVLYLIHEIYCMQLLLWAKHVFSYQITILCNFPSKIQNCEIS